MKSIKSRPRISAALIFSSILIGVCFLTLLCIRGLIKGNKFDSKGTMAVQLGLFVLIGTLIVFIVCLLRLKFISIDISNQRLTVIYPFQFKRLTFTFSDIAGFYLTSKTSRYLLHKVIVFRTVQGKEYSVSDFEVSNFNEVQVTVWPYLSLLDEQTKDPLSREQKEGYRTGSDREFNLKQVGSIRFVSRGALILFSLTAIIGSGLILPLNREFPISIWVFIVSGLLFSISKLIVAKRMVNRERDLFSRRDSNQHRLLR